jgi:hypothetical protein
VKHDEVYTNIVGRNTLVSAEDAAEAVMILLSMLVDAGSPKL